MGDDARRCAARRNHRPGIPHGWLDQRHQPAQDRRRAPHTDALYDSLTGLTNRGLFVAHLKSALGQRNRDEDFRFAVLAINLERFRLVNDSFGHASGDAAAPTR